MEAKSDEEEDDFQTDDDEEMEVDKQEQQKRKKVRENCLKLPVIQMLMSGISYKNPTGFFNDTTCCHIHVFQVQGGGFQKKFRNNHWKSGRKKRGKV